MSASILASVHPHPCGGSSPGGQGQSGPVQRPLPDADIVLTRSLGVDGACSVTSLSTVLDEFEIVLARPLRQSQCPHFTYDASVSFSQGLVSSHSIDLL